MKINFCKAVFVILSLYLCSGARIIRTKVGDNFVQIKQDVHTCIVNTINEEAYNCTNNDCAN